MKKWAVKSKKFRGPKIETAQNAFAAAQQATGIFGLKKVEVRNDRNLKGQEFECHIYRGKSSGALFETTVEVFPAEMLTRK